MSSLLASLVTSSSAAELRRAGQWLATPIHNARPDIRELFAYLADGGDPNDSIHGFPPAKQRSLEHHLLKRLEDFLVFERLRQQDAVHQRLLLDVYRERRLDAHRLTRSRRLLARGSKDGNLSREHYLLLHEAGQHAVEAAKTRDRVDRSGHEVGDWTLDAYLLTLKLRQACYDRARKTVSTEGGRSSDTLLPALLQLASQASFRDQPLVRAFHLGILLQPQDGVSDPVHAKELASLLAASPGAFSRQDHRSLLLVLINYGLRRINQGISGAAAITLGYYRKGLDEGTLLDRGDLSPFAFNNIVAIALHLGKTSWTHEFIDTYAPHLPEAKREEIVTLARARLAFVRGEDGAALQYLQRADFHDFIHHMSARILQLKIYFRQDNFNLLSAHLSSTLRLLARKRNRTGYHHENYHNIFSLARQLFALNRMSAPACSALRKKIEETEPCTEKRWLLELLRNC